MTTFFIGCIDGEDKEIKSADLSEGAQNAMDIRERANHKSPPGIYLGDVSDNAEHIAAKILDVVFECDTMNGLSVWTSVQEMADICLEEGDFRPESTKIDEALRLVEEVSKLTGNLA